MDIFFTLYKNNTYHYNEMLKESFAWTMYMFHILTKIKMCKKISPTIEYKLKPVDTTVFQINSNYQKGKIIK